MRVLAGERGRACHVSILELVSERSPDFFVETATGGLFCAGCAGCGCFFFL